MRVSRWTDVTRHASGTRRRRTDRAWQAARWAAPWSTSSTSTAVQRSLTPSSRGLDRTATSGQRGWKRHPAGSRLGSGISPVRICCSTRCCLGHHRQQRLGVRMLRSVEHLLGVPSSTTLPRYITAIRSAMFHAIPRSWVTATIDSPRSSTSERSSARISPRIEASSEPPARRRGAACGDRAIAPAISTRWRCPPEISCG